MYKVYFYDNFGNEFERCVNINDENVIAAIREALKDEIYYGLRFVKIRKEGGKNYKYFEVGKEKIDDDYRYEIWESKRKYFDKYIRSRNKKIDNWEINLKLDDTVELYNKLREWTNNIESIENIDNTLLGKKIKKDVKKKYKKDIYNIRLDLDNNIVHCMEHSDIEKIDINFKFDEKGINNEE